MNMNMYLSKIIILQIHHDAIKSFVQHGHRKCDLCTKEHCLSGQVIQETGLR